MPRCGSRRGVVIMAAMSRNATASARLPLDDQLYRP